MILPRRNDRIVQQLDRNVASVEERIAEIRSAAYFWGGQVADEMRSLDWSARLTVFDAAVDAAVDSLPLDLTDHELELLCQGIACTALEELGDPCWVLHPLQAALLGMSASPVHRLAAAAWSAAHPKKMADLPKLMRPVVLPMG
jgi:hypothetical protein